MAIKTGVDTAAGVVNFWNPTAGRYETVPYDWNNWSRGTREADKYSWYDSGIKDIGLVYGLKPPKTHQQLIPGLDQGSRVSGSDPNWKPPPPRDLRFSLGPGDDGKDPNYNPDGSIIKGGGADPDVWGPGGSNYWAPVNNSWDWSKFGGNKGTQTVDPGGIPTGGSGLSGKTPPSTGPKGPWLPGATNDEYYSRQFRAITEQRNAHQEAQKAAALRAQAAAAVPQQAMRTDWSWANNGKGLPKGAYWEQAAPTETGA